MNILYINIFKVIIFVSFKLIIFSGARFFWDNLGFVVFDLFWLSNIRFSF